MTGRSGAMQVAGASGGGRPAGAVPMGPPGPGSPDRVEVRDPCSAFRGFHGPGVSSRPEGRAGRRRSGFSLLELMIAIVIFGIGMVMVATIFPIGLGMSRDAVQMDISQAVADTAYAAIQLKLPRRQPAIDGVPGTRAYRVLAPDVTAIELPSVGRQVEITEPERNLLEGLMPWSPPWGMPQVGWEGWLLSLPSGGPTVQQALDLSRVFTERTAWPGQLNVGQSWRQALLLPSQNLPASPARRIAISDDTGNPPLDGLLARIPTLITPRLAGWQKPELAGLSLLDQVYPPVAWQPDSYDPQGTARREPGKVMADLVSRRYSWLALHHRTSGNDKEPEKIVLHVIVTWRPDLQSFFARQRDTDEDDDIYNPVFDPGIPADRAALLQPRWEDPPGGNPRDVGIDVLFPRPWLVYVNRIDLNAGLVRCSNEVASLVPPGAYLFVAAYQSAAVQPGFLFKVQAREFNGARPDDGIPGNHIWAAADPEDGDYWATLKVQLPGLSGELADVPVWVVPPPLDRQAGRFSDRSPVVGVHTYSVTGS